MNQSSAELRVTTGDIENTLLHIANASMQEFRVQYLTAASFLKNGSIIAWFNNQALHSASLALDLVHNAIIKTFFGEDHNIRVANAPLHFLPINSTTPNMPQGADSFGYSFTIIIGVIMSVLSASYISYYIKVSITYCVIVLK